MPKPERQILVCLNMRPADNPKGSCAAKGSEDVLNRLKAMLAERGLKDRVMINGARCLKHCSRGITVAVQPDNVWYAQVKLEDLDEILNEHIVDGRPVARLFMPDIPWE
jgi:(2Fe-2S) ferredoxin